MGRHWEFEDLSALSPATRRYAERQLRKRESAQERQDLTRALGAIELDDARWATIELLAGLRAEPSGFKQTPFRGRRDPW